MEGTNSKFTYKRELEDFKGAALGIRFTMNNDAVN
jgi:hypothetical protein